MRKSHIKDRQSRTTNRVWRATLCFLGMGICWLGDPSLALAQRIVSLLPSNTEILDALGAGQAVVGITRFDHAAAGREVVGDFLQPSLEKIVSLKPDLIVAGYSASNRSVARLRRLGYRVEEIHNPRSLAEMYDSVRALSKLVNKEEAAERVIRSMQGRVKHLQVRASQRSRRFKTYIEIDPPFWTIGGRDFISEALSAAGADNIFQDLERPSAQVSPETIVQRNPDLILSFNLSREDISRRAGWSRIVAVQKGWILDQLDRDALARPSPQLIAAVEALADQLDRLATP